MKRLRFYLEIGLVMVSSTLLALTLIRRDWIELLFGIDPDAHSGALEWLIVGVLFAILLISAYAGYRDWKRLYAIQR